MASSWAKRNHLARNRVSGVRIQNCAQGIRNPAKDFNPEPKFHDDQESGINGVESTIQCCLELPYMERYLEIDQLSSCARFMENLYSLQIEMNASSRMHVESIMTVITPLDHTDVNV